MTNKRIDENYLYNLIEHKLIKQKLNSNYYCCHNSYSNININKITYIIICLLLLLIIIKYILDKNILYLKEPQTLPSIDKIFPNEILEEPLKNFYINTSHNSYLSNNQIFGISRAKNTLGAIYTGSRCIELDIISGYNEIPFISHNGWDIKASTFESHCQVIKDFAFKLTNDPLIIYLEIHNANKENYMKNIAKLIDKYFKDRLYEHNIDNYTYNTYLPNAKLKDLLGKICIVINYFNMNIGEKVPNTNYNVGLKHSIIYLHPRVHATADEPDNGWFDTDYLMRNQNNKNKIENVFNKFVRVYPNNLFRSQNYNIKPFIENGYSLISMNKTNNDEFIKTYNDFFKISNIIPKYWNYTNNIWQKNIF
jgi:hypothetical protein